MSVSATKGQDIRERPATGPDFVGLGAGRSGTSWLHEVLSRHPALWLPPVKELHYLDEPVRSKRYYRYLRMRLITGFWFRRPLSRFDLQFFFGRRSDDWYRGLFEPARRRGLFTGEITPDYSVVEESSLRRLRALNPEVKLIYIMRDPVMRSWSAVMKRQRELGLEGQPEAEEAIRFAREKNIRSRSSYLENIERFERVFRRNQIYYDFFERVCHDPAGLTTEILQFIGVEPGDVSRLIPRVRVNAAADGLGPPREFSEALAADYIPWVVELCRHFEGPPHIWRAQYEVLLGTRTRSA
jgi:hypothetical protein